MNKKVIYYFWSGIITFWIPLVLLIYALKIVWPVIGKLSKPISRLLPFSNAFGEIFDFLIGVFIILSISVLIGWIAQKTILKWWTQRIDRILSRIFPGYSFYKNFLSNTPVDEPNKWKSVIINDENEKKLGFIVDEKDDQYIIYIPAVPNPYEGEMVLKKKSQTEQVDITFIQAVEIIRHYGKGFPEFSSTQKPDKQ